jgi:hypothetical protein
MAGFSIDSSTGVETMRLNSKKDGIRPLTTHFGLGQWEVPWGMGI